MKRQQQLLNRLQSKHFSILMVLKVLTLVFLELKKVCFCHINVAHIPMLSHRLVIQNLKILKALMNLKLFWFWLFSYFLKKNLEKSETIEQKDSFKKKEPFKNLLGVGNPLWILVLNMLKGHLSNHLRTPFQSI